MWFCSGRVFCLEVLAGLDCVVCEVASAWCFGALVGGHGGWARWVGWWDGGIVVRDAIGVLGCGGGLWRGEGLLNWALPACCVACFAFVQILVVVPIDRS